MPLLKNCCSTSLLPLDIKDSLKEDARFFDGGFLMGDGLNHGLLASMMLLLDC
jgi:hypothetical protein